MTSDRTAAFLAGERLDDVALYLSGEAVSNRDALLDRDVASPAGDGVLLVVDGDRGRDVFARLTGQDAMEFGGTAMQREGRIDASLTDGECPEGDGDGAHRPVFVFAFAEGQNAEAGGIYERGDVIHAYAQCSCGTAYGDRWVVGER
ncbi:MAG: DUF5807 family protein [Halanaeroarchaeum sp.]